VFFFVLATAKVSAVQGVEEQLRALAGKGKDLSLDRRARAQQEALQMVSGLDKHLSSSTVGAFAAVF
jgi:hypothetical protein